jgi:hypothetical protein
MISTPLLVYRALIFSSGILMCASNGALPWLNLRCSHVALVTERLHCGGPHSRIGSWLHRESNRGHAAHRPLLYRLKPYRSLSATRALTMMKCFVVSSDESQQTFRKVYCLCIQGRKISQAMLCLLLIQVFQTLIWSSPPKRRLTQRTTSQKRMLHYLYATYGSHNKKK